MTRRAFRVVVTVAALAVVGAVACLVVPPSEQAFHDYLAERRAAGLATTYAEFAGPLPPDSENGAPELATAWTDLLAAHGPTSAWTGSSFDRAIAVWPDEATPEQLTALAPLCVNLRPFRERIDTAISRPRLGFKLTRGPDGAPKYDHITLLQNSSRALATAAVGDEAREHRLLACHAQLALGRRIELLSWIDWMLSTTMSLGGVANLRRGIESGAIDPVSARASCDELLRGSSTAGLQRACSGEAVAILEQYELLVTGKATAPSSKLPLGDRLARRLDDVLARVTGKPVTLDLEPGMAPTVVGVCRGLDLVAVADPGTLLSPDGFGAADPDGMLRASDFRAAIPKLFRQARHVEAAQTLARVALAIAAHRAKHGDFPASLAELAAAFPEGIPDDFYADAPFAYTVSASGAVISSQGPPTSERFDPDETPHDRLMSWELKR